MQQRLPGTVLTALAAVAATTFLVGVLLEVFALGFLQGHPYFVNLLSGATGFSTTALIVATLFNRATTNQWVRQREHAMAQAAAAWRSTVRAAAALLEPPRPGTFDDLPHPHSPPRSPLPAVHCRELAAVLQEFWTFGRRSPGLPFTTPDGEPRFLDLAHTLAEQQVPTLLRLFDINDDIEMSAVHDRLRSAIADRRSFDTAVALRDFAALMQAHPHHVTYLQVQTARLDLSGFWRDLHDSWLRWRRSRWG